MGLRKNLSPRILKLLPLEKSYPSRKKTKTYRDPPPPEKGGGSRCHQKGVQIGDLPGAARSSSTWWRPPQNVLYYYYYYYYPELELAVRGRRGGPLKIPRCFGGLEIACGRRAVPGRPIRMSMGHRELPGPGSPPGAGHPFSTTMLVMQNREMAPVPILPDEI